MPKKISKIAENSQKGLYERIEDMKKTIFTLLAVVALFALAACTGDDTPAPPPAPGGAAETPAAGTTGDAAGDTAAETADAAEELDADALLILQHFPPVDLGGIVVRTNGLENPDHPDNAPAFAADAQARRDHVEEKFNITMEFDALAGLDWNAIPDIVTASVAAGDPIVHIFAGANAGYWIPQMASNGILVEGSDWIPQNFPPSWWQYVGEHMGGVYGFMTNPNTAWAILAFNTQLILQAGMDRTPQEMFIDGEWHLDDFYAYMSQLNTLLPDGVYTIGMHPTNWQRGAAFANGGFFKHPRTHAPGYLEEAFLQPARTMQQLIQSGIHMQPVFLNYPDDTAIVGGFWSFGGAAMNPMGEFINGNLAVVFANNWNFGEIAANFEFGVVPFPWGDNVTFPASGDWRDLKTENPAYNSFSNDASAHVLVQGSPAGLTHETMANIIFSFWPGAALNIIEARELTAQGLPAPSTAGGLNELWTDLDREIYNWYAANPIWEPLDGAATPTAVYLAWFNALGSGADLMTSFAAVIGEDVWSMYNAGLITWDDVPESVRLQAEEFGAVLAAAQAAAEDEEDEEDDDE